MSKSQMRQSALQSRRALPRSQVESLSSKVKENLESLPEFRDARVVASYVALPDEVQTMPILGSAMAMGKKVVVPLVDVAGDRLLFMELDDLSSLRPGHFAVLEPPGTAKQVDLAETDVVLVPLLVWDDRGNRIGYGRGYFDKALKTRGASVAIGLAFESQHVPRIPEGPSDVALDMVVTEDKVARFSPPHVRSSR